MIVVVVVIIIMIIMRVVMIVNIIIINNIRLGYLILEFNVYVIEDYSMYIVIYVPSESSGLFHFRDFNNMTS